MAFRFQNWKVYQDARIFRLEIITLTKTYPKEEKYLLVDQTNRAALSVVLEIAEGSNRKTEKDKNLFMNRALTSLDEIIGCLDCALDSKYIIKEQYAVYFEKAENIARQLRGFSKYISSSYK